MARFFPSHRLVAYGAVLALLLSGLAASAEAQSLEGRLTGSYADWGPLSVEALVSRDFAVPPAATAPVAPDGQFTLTIPPGTPHIYLALWPKFGGAYPILLRELPYVLPIAGTLELPIPPPPQHRDQRQAISAPSVLLLGGGMVLFFGLIVFGARRWIRPTKGPERWIPTAVKPVSVGPVLWAGLAAVAGLLAYGIFALDEAMDLLEYTYFQEAFAGSNPFAVAFSPVVAERAHAPGYAVTLWSLTTVSEQAAWLRIPALISVVVGGWALFRVTTEVTGNRVAGTLAALLGSMAPLVMRYGRDVTPYSMVGLLAILSTWLLYRALVSGERRFWIAYAAVGAGAFFLHYFTAFLTVGQAVAGVWLYWRGGRGEFWTGRLKQGLLCFFGLAALPLLWSGQVVRAFIISAQDNLVTHAVYPEAPGFLPYAMNHLRVLVGLPPDLAWLVWPMLLLVVAGFVVLLRDHPTFGRLLLVPFLMMVGLLVTTYVLHSYAYGGRVYYGWRWLRPYTPAIAIPVAYLMVRPLPRLGRTIAVGAGAAMVAATLYSGTMSAVTRERPAQHAAAAKLLELARDGDAVAVLPAAFYTVGWSFYLHGTKPHSMHPGPSMWEYFRTSEGHVKLFGPIRTFGVPIESLTGHVDVKRMWVAVFDEVIFGQPEFDRELPSHVLADLDTRMTWLKTWRFPRLELRLYQSTPPPIWPDGIRVDVTRLYRSMRWLPDALEPDYLFQVMRGLQPIRIRVPAPVSGSVSLAISGAPAGAVATDVRLDGGELQFENGSWTAKLTSERGDRVDVVIQRSEAARGWPLEIELKR